MSIDIVFHFYPYIIIIESYTMMQWDKKSKSWYSVEYCESLEDLRDELLSSYRMTGAEKLTKARGELTDEDNEIVKEKCKIFLCYGNTNNRLLINYYFR